MERQTEQRMERRLSKGFAAVPFLWIRGGRCALEGHEQIYASLPFERATNAFRIKKRLGIRRSARRFFAVPFV